MTGQVLITLQQAKDQVEANGFTDDDSRLLLRMEEASDIVLAYVTTDGKDDWTERTAPARVRIATLMVLANLYSNRGDGDAPSPLNQAVMDVLHADRDPPLA